MLPLYNAVDSRYTVCVKIHCSFRLCRRLRERENTNMKYENRESFEKANAFARAVRIRPMHSILSVIPF